MSRRTERVSNLIRNTLGQLMLAKMADPRIDPARTSITRVEMPEDLLTARVYVSVMGTEPEQRRTLQALRHAAGHLQELVGRQISLRNTPLLNFVLDTQFKKTIQTLGLIQQAMDEIHQKEQKESEEAAQPREEPNEDTQDTPS